jgi:hypothetical protein
MFSLIYAHLCPPIVDPNVNDRKDLVANASLKMLKRIYLRLSAYILLTFTETF